MVIRAANTTFQYPRPTIPTKKIFDSASASMNKTTFREKPGALHRIRITKG